jgi:hypothetical protein
VAYKAKTMKTASDFALLAPVPLVHLESAQELKGPVAFGSRAYDCFAQVKTLRGNDDVDVYLYASHPEGRDLTVRWHARYIGFVPAVKGLHPNPERRPLSSESDTADSLLFWEIEDLELLKSPIAIGTLQGLKNKKPYGTSFPPHGPILIKHPTRDSGR